MIRILAVILAIIVIVETIVPCCVFDSCAQELVTTDNHNDKAGGDCSPFSATCSSCVAGVDVVKPTVIELNNPVQLIKHNTPPLHFSLSSYSDPRYQPPKQA